MNKPLDAVIPVLAVVLAVVFFTSVAKSINDYNDTKRENIPSAMHAAQEWGIKMGLEGSRVMCKDAGWSGYFCDLVSGSGQVYPLVCTLRNGVTCEYDRNH